MTAIGYTVVRSDGMIEEYVGTLDGSRFTFDDHPTLANGDRLVMPALTVDENGKVYPLGDEIL